MPRTASGCQTCKIRRIKCDETEPVCRKCVKAKRQCLRQDAIKQDLSIHIENPYASGVTKRPRGPRSNLTAHRISVHLEMRAVEDFMQDHVQTIADVPLASDNLSECITTWRDSGRTCDLVDLGISSLALMMYSNTQKSPQAATEAGLKYERLLQSIQSVLANIEVSEWNEDSIDAFLLGIFTMGRYEGIVLRKDANESSTSLQGWSHHDGSKAVLKVWKDRMNCNHPSKIVKLVRRGLIRSSILRQVPLPEWMLDGSQFGECGSELEYDRLFVRLAAMYRHSLQVDHTDPCKIEELNKEAQDLDQGLRDWASRVFSSCSHEKHVLDVGEKLPAQHFYSSAVYSFSSSGYAVLWLIYTSTRMLVCNIRLRLLDMCCPNSILSFEYQQQEICCRNQLKDIADSFASTLPFCLERFKSQPTSSTDSGASSLTLNTTAEIKPCLANHAIWPLTIASGITKLDCQQLQWFRSELVALGRLVGGGVFERAGTEQWFSF